MNKQPKKPKSPKTTTNKVKSPPEPIPLAEEIRGLLREYGFIKIIAEALEATNRRTIARKLPEIIELVTLGLDGSLGQKRDVLDRPTLTELIEADRADAAKTLLGVQWKQCIASQAAIGKFAQEEMKRRLIEVANGKTLVLD